MAFLLLNRRGAVTIRVANSPAANSNLTTTLSKPSKFVTGRITASTNITRTSAEQFVAQKLTQFGQSRRALAHALAKKHGVEVPPEVERFFAAVQSGDWDRIKSAFDAISAGDASASHNDKRTPEVNKLWPAIHDSFGVAEQVHLWPAQSLVDYGNSILNSLEPGMVYVGGTDSSRWVPALLNDTSISSHIVITQNGLAGSDYLDYIALQFGDRMQTLTHDESKTLYQDYLKDLQKRYEHDQQNPDAPKQVRANEQFKVADGKITDVMGRDAVFDMNERLLKKLMEKNPELSFALGESVPLTGTYADAVPIGHLMELNSKNEFTSERASQSLDYWRQLSQNILSNPEASSSDSARRSYSHDTVAAGNLFAAHNFNSEAEARTSSPAISGRPIPKSPLTSPNSTPAPDAKPTPANYSTISSPGTPTKNKTSNSSSATKPKPTSRISSAV
ncbi:MAG TPA: hypothetical protein VF773_11340 [Verrucomicrobiae bacterium]